MAASKVMPRKAHRSSVRGGEFRFIATVLVPTTVASPTAVVAAPAVLTTTRPVTELAILTPTQPLSPLAATSPVRPSVPVTVETAPVVTATVPVSLPVAVATVVTATLPSSGICGGGSGGHHDVRGQYPSCDHGTDRDRHCHRDH